MALVAWVMKVRPLKLVFCRNQGRAPQWSKWKLWGRRRQHVSSFHVWVFTVTTNFCTIWSYFSHQITSKINIRIRVSRTQEKPDRIPEEVFSGCCDDKLDLQNSLADEQQVDFSWIDQVDVRQSVHSLQTRMDPTVQLNTQTKTCVFARDSADFKVCCWRDGTYHNLSSLELQDDAGSSHLLSCSSGHKHTEKPSLSWFRCFSLKAKTLTRVTLTN